jgi:hypothetical protein
LDIFDDFSEKLAGEVMADMADNYFGARKRLDDLVDIFHQFVDKCREKGEAVEADARGFNALLTGTAEAARFYERIGVTDPDPLLASASMDRAVLDHLPDAFTLKGRYIKTARKVYERLQKRCDDYLHGPPDFTDPEDLQDMEAHYDLIVRMAKSINQQIEKINKSRSPGSMLQYVRGFQPEWDQKADIAGSNLVGFADGVDEKLTYKPIRFEELGLKHYPDLPEPDRVAKPLKSICADLYSRQRDAVAESMEKMKALSA